MTTQLSTKHYPVKMLVSTASFSEIAARHNVGTSKTLRGSIEQNIKHQQDVKHRRIC
jgi:hypothetical protein